MMCPCPIQGRSGWKRCPNLLKSFFSGRREIDISPTFLLKIQDGGDLPGSPWQRLRAPNAGA